MTSKEALKFNFFSKRNAKKLESVCPHCKAYVDWLTFNRWLAVGRSVKKGEHATYIPKCVDREEFDEEGNEKIVYSTGLIPVFCKCQTQAI